jgi:hypothetical protein
MEASIAALDRKLDVSVAALDRKLDASVAALDHKIETLDEKVTRQYAVLSQDIRMIRVAIREMADTSVTRDEFGALRKTLTACSSAWMI